MMFTSYFKDVGCVGFVVESITSATADAAVAPIKPPRRLPTTQPIIAPKGFIVNEPPIAPQAHWPARCPTFAPTPSASLTAIPFDIGSALRLAV